MNEETELSRIEVGLPWGQFQGLSRTDSLETTLSI